jgi:hypothetical protein
VTTTDPGEPYPTGQYGREYWIVDICKYNQWWYVKIRLKFPKYKNNSLNK